MQGPEMASVSRAIHRAMYIQYVVQPQFHGWPLSRTAPSLRGGRWCSVTGSQRLACPFNARQGGAGHIKFLAELRGPTCMHTHIPLSFWPPRCTAPNNVDSATTPSTRTGLHRRNELYRSGQQAGGGSYVHSRDRKRSGWWRRRSRCRVCVAGLLARR
jgi:hypothetical protein